MHKRAARFIIALFFATGSAQAFALKPFSATFKVEALGMHLGYAQHRLRCQNDLCQLTSDAKPIGLARFLVAEQNHEKSIFSVSTTELNWLSYENIIKSTRNKSIKDQFTVIYDSQSQQNINPQRDQHWDAQPNTFDALSMAYALQYRLIKQQPIEPMILQEEKRQRSLDFKKQHNASLNTEFKTHLHTHYFIANADDYRVSVWLAPELDFFPVQVEIYDKKRRRGMTLSLTTTPTYP